MNYKKEISERLKKLISSENISASEFAKALSKPNSTIYRWLNAEALPKIIEIKNICQLYNIDPNWLLMGDSAMYSCKTVSTQRTRFVLINDSLEELGRQEITNNTVLSILDNEENSKTFAAVKVNNDEMQPSLIKNDICVISHPGSALINKIAAIDENGKRFFRRIAHYEKKIVLVADNPTYKPISLPKAEVKIIGIVKRVIRDTT